MFKLTVEEHQSVTVSSGGTFELTAQIVGGLPVLGILGNITRMPETHERETRKFLEETRAVTDSVQPVLTV